MSNVFRVEVSVVMGLSDYDPAEGPLDRAAKRDIEKRVIKLLGREYPDVDAEIIDVRIEEE